MGWGGELMSLSSLIKMRYDRERPASVWVVVGVCPERLIDLPFCIAVTERPAFMDWRPVVGLHVDVFDLSGNPKLLDQTIGALESANAGCIGVCCELETIGLSPAHEMNMKHIRRHLAHT